MSTFDPNTFLSTEEAGALSTTFEPIPDGEYEAMIGAGDEALKPRVTQSGRHILDVTWELNDEALRERLGREKLTVRQSLFLDMTSQGTLDRGTGKNVQLGRLREALGQNDPSKPWSPMMLRGAGPAKIRITQRAGDDGVTIYNDVKAVTKLR